MRLRDDDDDDRGRGAVLLLADDELELAREDELELARKSSRVSHTPLSYPANNSLGPIET